MDTASQFIASMSRKSSLDLDSSVKIQYIVEPMHNKHSPFQLWRHHGKNQTTAGSDQVSCKKKVAGGRRQDHVRQAPGRPAREYHGTRQWIWRDVCRLHPNGVPSRTKEKETLMPLAKQRRCGNERASIEQDD